MRCFNGYTYTLTKYGRTPRVEASYMAGDEFDLIDMIRGFGYEIYTNVESDVPILVFGKHENLDETSFIIIDDFGEAK